MTSTVLLMVLSVIVVICVVVYIIDKELKRENTEKSEETRSEEDKQYEVKEPLQEVLGDKPRISEPIIKLADLLVNNEGWILNDHNMSGDEVMYYTEQGCDYRLSLDSFIIGFGYSKESWIAPEVKITPSIILIGNQNDIFNNLLERDYIEYYIKECINRCLAKDKEKRRTFINRQLKEI